MIDKKEQFALGLRFNLSFNADNDNNAILDALYEYKEKKKIKSNFLQTFTLSSITFFLIL